MKKLFLLFVPLFAMSLCITSCSDDEEEILDGVALMVFDNYKVISNYEFELSNDSGEMYFDRFSCVNTENKNISDTWDYATHNNVDKKDKFVYMINKDTIFTVHNGCHQVAIAVVIHDALLLDNGACLGGHLFAHDLVGLFEFLDLVNEHRRTGIALDTAYSLAVREVTEEILLKKVE